VKYLISSWFDKADARSVYKLMKKEVKRQVAKSLSALSDNDIVMKTDDGDSHKVKQVPALNLNGGSGSDPNICYIPDPEWQDIPRDERDKIIAVRKAACNAKNTGRSGGGSGSGKWKGGAHNMMRQAKKKKSGSM